MAKQLRTAAKAKKNKIKNLKKSRKENKYRNKQNLHEIESPAC